MILLFYGLLMTVVTVTYLYLGVKYKNWLYLVVGLILLVLHYCFFYDYTKQNTFTPEYELEIINQDSVRVRSLSTGRVYTERYNQIQDALIKDNL